MSFAFQYPTEDGDEAQQLFDALDPTSAVAALDAVLTNKGAGAKAWARAFYRKARVLMDMGAGQEALELLEKAEVLATKLKLPQAERECGELRSLLSGDTWESALEESSYAHAVSLAQEQLARVEALDSRVPLIGVLVDALCQLGELGLAGQWVKRLRDDKLVQASAYQRMCVDVMALRVELASDRVPEAELKRVLSELPERYVFLRRGLARSVFGALGRTSYKTWSISPSLLRICVAQVFRYLGEDFLLLINLASFAHRALESDDGKFTAAADQIAEKLEDVFGLPGGSDAEWTIMLAALQLPRLSPVQAALINGRKAYILGVRWEKLARVTSEVVPELDDLAGKPDAHVIVRLWHLYVNGVVAVGERDYGSLAGIAAAFDAIALPEVGSRELQECAEPLRMMSSILASYCVQCPSDRDVLIDVDRVRAIYHCKSAPLIARPVIPEHTVLVYIFQALNTVLKETLYACLCSKKSNRIVELERGQEFLLVAPEVTSQKEGHLDSQLSVASGLLYFDLLESIEHWLDVQPQTTRIVFCVPSELWAFPWAGLTLPKKNKRIYVRACIANIFSLVNIPTGRPKTARLGAVVAGIEKYSSGLVLERGEAEARMVAAVTEADESDLLLGGKATLKSLISKLTASKHRFLHICARGYARSVLLRGKYGALDALAVEQQLQDKLIDTQLLTLSGIESANGWCSLEGPLALVRSLKLTAGCNQVMTSLYRYTPKEWHDLEEAKLRQEALEANREYRSSDEPAPINDGTSMKMMGRLYGLLSARAILAPEAALRRAMIDYGTDEKFNDKKDCQDSILMFSVFGCAPEHYIFRTGSEDTGNIGAGTRGQRDLLKKKKKK